LLLPLLLLLLLLTLMLLLFLSLPSFVLVVALLLAFSYEFALASTLAYFFGSSWNQTSSRIFVVILKMRLVVALKSGTYFKFNIFQIFADI
jgi:ABC-type dipeptide/oligopeptide/nickel transport system permease component